MLSKKYLFTLLSFALPLFSTTVDENIPRKKALIFGITGQDGAYLTEFLLNKNYEVHGVKRKSSQSNTGRIDRFYQDPQHSKNFFLHYGDLTDAMNVVGVIRAIQPDEIYNLAAQSHVQVSFELPNYTTHYLSYIAKEMAVPY